ncbi:DUF5707 domain-containing protein [Streptomyces corynorhini]|uniref:Calcium-binding protein n=1 Tax=Streptomyces corynorhini TaxID=2282652 RepID=A0A370BBK5_9ACTN|nr:DUF5707 domain-containing protein [Streptomyces corynorhini]RDG39021.1 calcium-binding protein [Streptomyces corynorhini]
MRTRAAVAAVSGALVLSALAVPVSHAADSRQDSAELARSIESSFRDRVAAAPSAAPKGALAGTAAKTVKTADTAPKVTKVVVNGGKPVVLGATGSKKVSVSYTVSHASGIYWTLSYLWTGGAKLDSITNIILPEEDEPVCKAVSATTSNCTYTAKAEARYLFNNEAKNWNVATYVVANSADSAEKEKAGTVKFQRASQLTVTATPKPVKKGKTLTVTGKLSRANWETGKNAGYAGQPVKLQFRKKGSSTYTTIKTVKGSSTGTLKTTTTKTTAEGYWRWSFAGTASTPAVSAPGTLVKIKK